MKKQYLKIAGKRATLLTGGSFYETVEGNLVHIPSTGGPQVFEPNQWLEFNEEKTPKKGRDLSQDRAWMRPRRITSPNLRKICGGATVLPHTEINKLFWKFVKDNKLQSPKNMRNIQVGRNPITRAIFKKAEISMFEITKELSKHLK